MRDVLDSQNSELEAAGSRQSWHDLYKSSSWIYVGGLDYGLTEGDIEAVFSQYGKIMQLNYVKDRDTGKPKGFSFICFEDQRATVLSVDNLNGIRLCNRFLKVDHVRDYKPPDEDGNYEMGGGGGYSRGGGDRGGGRSSGKDRKRDDRPGFGYSKRDGQRDNDRNVGYKRREDSRSKSRSRSRSPRSGSRSPPARSRSPPRDNNRGGGDRDRGYRGGFKRRE